MTRYHVKVFIEGGSGECHLNIIGRYVSILQCVCRVLSFCRGYADKRYGIDRWINEQCVVWLHYWAVNVIADPGGTNLPLVWLRHAATVSQYCQPGSVDNPQSGRCNNHNGCSFRDHASHAFTFAVLRLSRMRSRYLCTEAESTGGAG